MSELIDYTILYGMSIEKSIKLISEVINKKNVTFEQIKALNLAKSILEKQIPKKVIYGYDDQDDILCPNCKEIIGYMDSYTTGIDKYCSECGQMLDWKE